MEPTKCRHYPAMIGCGYVYRDNGYLEMKTKKGWEYTAKRMAEKMSKRDRFRWNPMLVWVEWRDCWRISFAGQQEK